MAFTKLGELLGVQLGDIKPMDIALANPDVLSRMADDSEILNYFKKVAADLKQIAPKAKDFLYFSAIMMHAAEASLIDADGSLKKDARGNPVKAVWEKSGDSLKWHCTDSAIFPYRNSNRDIFPEEELIKAHKKWVGRPLCIDHKSSSVDMIRGVIVDTYYDFNNKRVIALCALDKINYPDLARKVATGYSTSVSMGTAVGKAICTDCGRVAKVEADFCDHMNNKSCYGEINVALSPIELSIVVNGADPNAKIRHIVAAADSLSTYIDMKQVELNKLAEDETKDIELASKIEAGLEKAMADLAELKNQVAELKGNEQAEQAKDVGKVEDNSFFPKEASNIAYSILEMQKDLIKLRKDINKLSTKNGEEIEMTNKLGYWQGAGGVNEPTPGKPKYEKEDAEKIRNNDDKIMSSAVDTGPVNGLFPGDEQKKKELQRIAAEHEAKLRRQAALDRAKAAISDKVGYIQGGGGANEPTPGKVKYPKEDAEKVREKDDKQMAGAPPFPGVGKIDGLFDKDLETKKKWLRASLKAKFVKAAKPDGTQDFGQSCWQVYADDKLVLTATVAEITRNQAESLYSSVATKEFGRELITKIKTEGFEKAASLYKAAQELPAPMASPPPVGGVSADPMTPSNDVMDSGKSGSPKEMIPELIRQCQNHLSDLSLAFEALTNEPANELDNLGDMAGDAPMGAAATVNLISLRKKLSKALRVGIKQATGKLTEHIEELKLAETLSNDDAVMKKASTDGKDSISKIVNDACVDARSTVADSLKLMGAVVKYSRGTQSLIKRAKKEMEMKKSAQVAGLEGVGDSTPQVEKSLSVLPGHGGGDKRVNPATGKAEHLMHGKWFADGTNMYWDGKEYLTGPSKPAAKAPGGTAPSGSQSGVAYDPAAVGGTQNAGLMDPAARGKALHMGDLAGRQPDAQHKGVGANDTSSKSPMVGTPGDFSNSAHAGEAGAKADDGAADDVTVTKTDGTKAEMGKDVAKEVLKDASFDMSTKEGRAAFRAKLAKDMGGFNPILNTAHPGGGFTTKLEVKPTGDLAKVETLEEKHKAMLDVANAPPKVRKMAEEIEKYVKLGKIDPQDFDGLIAQGLDGDAVKYWKQFYSQAKDGGSQFAADLVKDVANKKAAEDKEALKVKVSRAYSLAHEMAARAMIGTDTSSISVQANEILGWTDENFDSIKRLIARQPLSKNASAMPQVGMIGTGDITIPAPEAEPSNMRVQLESLWAHKRY